MIISPISSVTTPALQAASAINLVTINPLSPTISSNPGLLDAIRSNNITVDVSALGELLAYTARLQSRRTANVSTAASPAASTTNNVTQADATQTKADVAQLTAIASSFVDAFNQLQASNSNLAENPLIPTSSDSLLQAMNAGAQNTDGSSLFEQLGDIGINLQNAAQPDNNSFLTLDVDAFQNALAEDPAGTATLLTQALQVLGSAESTVLTQNQELASGNLLATTGSTDTDTENIDVANSTSSTDTNTTVSSSSLNEEVTTAATNASTNVNSAATTGANIQLQQTLEDEALRAAIDTTRNSQVAAAATNADTATNSAQATSDILPALTPATTTSDLSATSNVANTIQTGATATPATDTSAEVTRIIPASDTSTITSNTALRTQTTTQDTNTNAATTDSSTNANAVLPRADTTDIAADTSSQALNTQATTQTATQTPSADNLDTTTPANTLAGENKLTANSTTPSSLLTESQLENQVVANSTKPNENLASDADVNTAVNNVKATANTPSTFDEVSKTLDTINQATAAANNIAANSQTTSVSPASTTVAVPVTSTTIIESTTPANNSAVVSTSANAASIQANINPLISAAVAAYRVKDGIQADGIDKPRSAESDEVTAPEPVTVVEPVTLDLHEHAQSQRHDAEADSAYHQAEDLGEPEKEGAVAGNININA